ncbi:MAG: ABC transporter ATP-binding protein [Planctomycetota bacterium]
MTRQQPPQEQPILRVDDLAVSFGQGSGPRTNAVDGVSLSIFQRQTLAVVGESGCGKSVTAMSILGLVPSPPSRVERGRINYQDRERTIDLLQAGEPTLRQIRGGSIAMIFQEPMTSLNPVLTIGEQLLEPIRLHRGQRGRDAKRLAVESLEQVGIRDAANRLNAYPHEFSGGMRQRAMIAMALACQPKLLIADEPTTALDVTIQKQILDLLGSLKSEHGLSIMLITHDLGVVAEQADVVCVMYAGRVVEYAPAPVLFRRPLHPYTRALLACIPTLDRDRPADQALETVSRLTADEAEWNQLGEALAVPAASCRPWWPTHTSIAATLSDGPASYGLREVEPEHWVGLWVGPRIDSAQSGFASGHPTCWYRRAAPKTVGAA